jgi:predicted PurR-regulated permease PerM
MEPSKKNSVPFFIALGLAAILFLYLLKPFFFTLFWAAVIAGIFRPLYRRIDGRLNRPNLSTAVLFLIIALILFLPALVAGTLIFRESFQLYESLRPDAQGIGRGFQRIVDAIAGSPLADLFHVNRDLLVEKTTEVIRGILNYIFVHLKDLTQNTLGLIVKLAVMLYTLFFFIRDGEKFLQQGMRLANLGMGRERFLYERFITTARSTLKVTLIIGGIQGIIGGLVFFVAGIDGAVIWGLLMILLAIVPLVGCSIIWGPAGVLMLLTGRLWEGILILAVGLLVISTVDNVLRPILVGKDVAMHPLLIFLSTLGGIVLFGFSGFVIGPIVAALLLSILQMYEEFYRKAPADEG